MYKENSNIRFIKDFSVPNNLDRDKRNTTL